MGRAEIRVGRGGKKYVESEYEQRVRRDRDDLMSGSGNMVKKNLKEDLQ